MDKKEEEEDIIEDSDSDEEEEVVDDNDDDDIELSDDDDINLSDDEQETDKNKSRLIGYYFIKLRNKLALRNASDLRVVRVCSKVKR